MVLECQIRDSFLLISILSAINKESNNMSKCGCGRSPTGMCKGWHGLSKDEYEAKLKEYEQAEKEE